MSKAIAFLVVLLLAIFVQNSSGAAVIVADYVDDAQTGSPAPGWRYLWNEFGPIGTATNYDDLAWKAGPPESDFYTATGGDRFADPSYDALHLFANTDPTIAHPGPGTSEGAPFDRYVIMGYTIQAGDPLGIFALTDSSVTSDHGGSNGIDLRVYVNDALTFSTIIAGGDSVNYDGPLGTLAPGDTVYVALGPNGHHAVDWIGDLDFTLSVEPSVSVNPLPEPSTSWLLAIGCLMITGRGQRRKYVAK